VTSSILIVDDHPVFCAAMSMIVETAEPGAQVTSVPDLASAQVSLRAQAANLVLLDLGLPDVQGMSGILLLRQVRPTATFAIVSASTELELMHKAAECGAQGFIPKTLKIDVMIAAVKALLIGGQWFPEGFYAASVTAEERAFVQRFSDLSAAQLRVLRAIADGRLNKQIAHDLGIAETTVKTHLQAIFRKLKVANRTQAVLAMNDFDAMGGG
jgi:DNA-binding NarL/FixJ family response regulator